MNVNCILNHSFGRFRDDSAARSPGFHRRSARRVAVLASIFFIATAMRLLFLNADPPLGLLDSGPYHDEGQYTHNMALFGVWRLPYGAR